MKYKIFPLLILISILGSSQENKTIDSLNNEIIILEKRIEEIKAEIKDEILQNGYFISVEGNYSFSEIIMKKKVYGKTIDTIPKGAIIKILGKKSGYYKIEHDNTIGFVNSYTLKIDSFPHLNLLDYEFNSKKNNTSQSFKTRNRKILDYSKPIHVRGHYRTTKSGKRVWVRPHTRKN